MISTLFWVGVGIVVKTLVPMPWVDVLIRNLWAKALGYTQQLETYSTKAPLVSTTPPVVK